MLKLLLATIVFAHDVGHLLFLAPTLRIAEWAHGPSPGAIASQ